MVGSRFATEEEVFSKDFNELNTELLSINKEFDLIDHTELNFQRFSWASRILEKPSYYASRMWEYPFAILSSDLINGMKCADVGCGTTPFTVFLAKKAGAENVTGFDPDLIPDDQKSHYAFGIRKSFLNKIGINFKQNQIQKLDCPDNSFDRVYCISVIEHITDPMIRLNGLKEMARVLKPGGRLILTMDMGINIPLTNPLESVLYSGLLPMGNLDLNWPQKRFVKMNDATMDVFGLVLQNPDGQIFSDYNSTKYVDMFGVWKTFIPVNFSAQEYQILRDLRSNCGMIKFIAKKILNRY